MIYVIYIFLVLLAFLVMLNGYVRGAKKTQIDAVLSLLLIALFITAFLVYDSKTGLLALGVAFISAVITRPIAARIASKLFGLSSGESVHFTGLPPRPLERISRELGQSIDPNQVVQELLGGDDQRNKAENALLDYCEGKSEIREVLHEYQISRDGLRELYSDLIVAGAGQWVCGHWVAASALAYPDTLRYVLARKRKDKMETAFNLIMHFERGAPLQE